MKPSVIVVLPLPLLVPAMTNPLMSTSLNERNQVCGKLGFGKTALRPYRGRFRNAAAAV
jgi:hypothetical protein